MIVGDPGQVLREHLSLLSVCGAFYETVNHRQSETLAMEEELRGAEGYTPPSQWSTSARIMSGDTEISQED